MRNAACDIGGLMGTAHIRTRRGLMKNFIAMLCLLSALSTIGCAATQAQGNKGGRVCREVEMTGSRIPKEVCITEDKQRSREIEDRLELERIQRSTPYNRPGN
jgi:hypothetical protein